MEETIKEKDFVNLTERDRCRLYQWAALAAFIAVIFFRRNLSAEIVAFNGFGILDVPAAAPLTAREWFDLLLENPLVGLVMFNLGDVINYLLVGMLFIGFYAALNKVDHDLAMLALALTLVGIIIFIATNQALPMAFLSRQYAAAGTDVQRALLLEEGESLLTIDNPGAAVPGMGYLLGLAFVTTAGLIYALLMLRSKVFNKPTAWMGILATAIQLLYFPLLAFAPAWVTLPFVLSAPLRVTWYVLAGIRLWKIR